MLILLAAASFLGFYSLKLLTVSPVPAKVPLEVLCLIAGVLSSLSAFLSIRLWQWYDSKLYMFSRSLRLLDLFTWILVVWFCLVQYRAFNSSVVNHSQLPLVLKYLNIYFWGGFTSLGFIVVGAIRLIKEKEIF